MKNKPSPPAAVPIRSGWLVPLMLLGVLGLLFWRSFSPEYVHFSNDGPLGQQSVNWLKLPASLTGMWDDLNDVGYAVGSFTPCLTALVKFALGPVGYAKFYAPIALFILGLGAWTFFRALKLSPLAATLGAFAAALSSAYLGNACWGVASAEIALGFDFLALALVTANTLETPRLTRWRRLVLAGFCVGINVIEAADIGALCSITVALFTFYKSVAENEGSTLQKIARGIGRVTILAVFAGFLATQTVVSLVTTQIQGVAGTAQDTETKAANWDKATQWSLPKLETLGLFVPGLFGYKMDTPKNMMPSLQQAYQGGAYWGGMGRTPALDRYFDNGCQGVEPSGPGISMRFSGGGEYCGILVILLAIWTVAQSFRRQSSVFSAAQNKLIWFWTVVLVASLLFAWGRFAPMFYGTLYQLPYFSTIRNPSKFVIFFCWAAIVLFAYAIHALSQRQLDSSKAKPADLLTQLQNWWARAAGFDRNWFWFCLSLLGASILGCLIFPIKTEAFVAYLQKVGYPDEAFAKQIAAFSLGQVVWFIALLAIGQALLTLIMAGYFSGPRARLGAMLLGAFLLFDLGRADLPYITHWDYRQKYEVGTLNPIVKLLTEKPYAQRVAALPYEPQQRLRGYDYWFGGLGVYRIEWMQHHFPYYNVQCLDWIQMPRMAEDLQAYLQALGALEPRDTPESLRLITRRWELSNTRYLLGAAGFLDTLNQQLDPMQHRFRIAQRFDLVPKLGVIEPTQLEELTAILSNDGDLALFEFTGALPRAKLYGNWQVNTNDEANLKTLADLNFDPAKTVLISTPEKNLPANATGENTGTVEFKSYAPKHVVLAANNLAPAVLLLNDKFDANWSVRVDGQPADLLRCNFLMRGVRLEPGTHTVEFNFTLPDRPMQVTLAAFALAALLTAWLAVSKKTV